jgi:DnaJ like chaperone protein
MGQIAKADGRICEKEIKATQVLFEKMGLNSDLRREAIELFKSGAEDEFDFNATLANFVNQPNIHANLKKIFLVYLISIAFADDQLHEAEDRMLKIAAQRLGFSVFAYQQLLGMIEAQRYFYQGQQERAYYSGGQTGSRRHPDKDELTLAYSALGVSPAISDKELKQAWRKLMSENHPDKLAGSGVPEDMVKLATERSQEIQAAYDLIKKHRKPH